MDSPGTAPDGSSLKTEALKHTTEDSLRGEGHSSPPPNCAICLGNCQNKSFTDSCLHQFCFNCLLTWSKIKAECPLCKQTFKSIIHNVRSNHQYEEYVVEQQAIQVETLPVEDAPIRRFRYRTTITFPRSDGTAIERLLLRHADVIVPAQRDAYSTRRPFRQAVYRHNLWARFLPDFTGRLRECTPEFYRANEAQRYRLVPWLTRELDFLLENNHSHIAYVMAQILDLIPVYSIVSPEFHRAMLPFFRERTEHFLHELLVFASTPYDMLGYDRNVQYDPDPRLGANMNHVISSSESDSDVVMVDRAIPTLPVHQNVIPIETISHSDTDDSSAEVIMTGYIKPPQDRTPEVVDLLASDSDVIVQETPLASTSRAIPSASAVVKLTLSRRVCLPDSSDDEFVPRLRMRTKARSHSSASTTSDRRDTPSPSEASWNPDTSTVSSYSREPSPSYTPPLPHVRLMKRKLTKEKRKKIKKRREKSRSPKPKDRDRKKYKKSKKSKRTYREKSNKTTDLDRPGPSKDIKTEKKMRSVICTIPIGSFNRFNQLNPKIENSHEPGPSTAGCSKERDASTSEGEDRCVRTKRPRRIIPPSSDSEDNIPLNLTLKKK